VDEISERYHRPSFLALLKAIVSTSVIDEINRHYITLAPRTLMYRRAAKFASLPTTSRFIIVNSISKKFYQFSVQRFTRSVCCFAYLLSNVLTMFKQMLKTCRYALFNCAMHAVFVISR
jgi:hypothetical protein